MVWFWRFAGCGFLGFLLETAHAKWKGDGSERKCLLFLPLCPVYGLGGCACAALRPLADALSTAYTAPPAASWTGPLSTGVLALPAPLIMFPLGALGCTAVEYAMGAWYEWCAGVPFWDYGGKAGSVRGRICLAFSALWGALSVAAAYGILPVLDALAAAVPPPVSAAACLLAAADLAASHVLLRRTRDRACLRRFGFPRRRRGAQGAE